MKLMFPTHIKTVEQFERDGNTFEPQAHFTGRWDYKLGDVELGVIQLLIYKYQDFIAVQHCSSPLPGMFSVELQFNDLDAWRKCLKEYQDSFTKSGNIKKSVVLRVRQDVALAELMDLES